MLEKTSTQTEEPRVTEKASLEQIGSNLTPEEVEKVTPQFYFVVNKL